MAELPQLASISVGSPLLPLYPKTFEEIYRFSTTAYKAGMIPRQNKREKIDNKWQTVEEEPETVLARGVMLIMQGMDVGMPPMAALQTMALINGRITIYGEGVPGLLLARGFKVKRWWTGSSLTAPTEVLSPDIVPTDNLTHHTQITRPDGQVFIGTFSVGDAKRARLWDERRVVTRGYGQDAKEVPNDSPWHCYWPRMLQARSIGFASKDGAADVLRGIAVREEIEDIERMQRAIDVTPSPGNSTRISQAALARSSAPAFDISDIPDDEPEPEPAAAPTRAAATAARTNATDVETRPAADAVDEPPSEAAIIRQIERALIETPEKADAIREAHYNAIRNMSEEGRAHVLAMFDAVFLTQV